MNLNAPAAGTVKLLRAEMHTIYSSVVQYICLAAAWCVVLRGSCFEWDCLPRLLQDSYLEDRGKWENLLSWASFWRGQKSEWQEGVTTAPLSLLELCWDCLAGTEQTSFVLAALACGNKSISEAR